MNVAPSTPAVFISGAGHCLPERIVTNHDLEKIMNTSDEFIVRRTGVRERRHVEAQTWLADLMLPACHAALERASLAATAIDMLIVNTLSPDFHDPSQACLLQGRLGTRTIPAFDIRAQCSGALYALDIAARFIGSGACRHVLVVCGEILSKRMDPSDEGRNLSILLGDGAGAFVVSKGSGDRLGGLLDIQLGADGSQFSLLQTVAPGSQRPRFIDAEAISQGQHFFRMRGRAMFEHATATLASAAEAMLAKHRLTVADLDSVLVHQPNLSILDAVRRTLNVSDDQMPINVDRYGNMASASLPVTLSEAFGAGRLAPGKLHLLLAYGSGATWGTALYRS